MVDIVVEPGAPPTLERVVARAGIASRFCLAPAVVYSWRDPLDAGRAPSPEGRRGTPDVWGSAMKKLIFATLVCSLALAGAAAPAVARTSDAALGWVKQASFPGPQLTGVSAATPNDVWAVGSSGPLLGTVDGGTTWTPRADPSVYGAGEYFYDVAAVPPGRCWAVGQNGIILADVAGADWVQQTSPSTNALVGVSAIDANHAWIAGGSGLVLVTPDGGATWTQQASAATAATGQPLDDIDFADLDHGWAVGFNGTIIVTANGGTTWKAQTAPPAAATQSIDAVTCSDPTHAWAGYGDGTILATKDGGKTWSVQANNAGMGGILDMTCTDADHVWVAALGGILATSNGGASWKRQSVGTSSAIAGVTFASESVGWAVARDGSIFKTTDGGWGDTSRPVTKALNSVTVKRGARASMRYKVIDPTPPGDTATVTIVVKSRGGKTVKTWGLGIQLANKVLSCRHKITLRKGGYRWYVYAYDAAENSASKIGSNKLVVN